MRLHIIASAVSLACLSLAGCGGGGGGSDSNSESGSNSDNSNDQYVIDGSASSFEELQLELEKAKDGDEIVLSGNFATSEPVHFVIDKSITITGASSTSFSTHSQTVLSGNVCFDIPDTADGHSGITLSHLHFDNVAMEKNANGFSCGTTSTSRSVINIGKVIGTNEIPVKLDNLSFNGASFDEVSGSPSAWIYSRGLVEVTNSTFENKQTSGGTDSIIYLNCGSYRAQGSRFDGNHFSLSESSSDVAGVWIGQFDGKDCAADVTNNYFGNFVDNTTESQGAYAAVVDGSADKVRIANNVFDNDGSNPVEPERIVAPYSIDAFKNVIKKSKLQRWDESLDEGEKTEISNSELMDESYFDDYFYAYEGSNELVFKMWGDGNRAELRVEENFDITDADIARVLSASLQPIGIQETLANSDGDEVTFLQVHNKGTNEQGEGYIPHPLLRVVYEEERNIDGVDYQGHYLAVIKTNAMNCSSGGEHEGQTECESENAYQRFSLGKADLTRMTDIDVIISESTLSIKVDGQTTDVDNFDISYWDHLLSYFKAGVYNQYDDYDDQQWSEVRFSKLNVLEFNTDGWDIDSWKITLPTSKDDWYGSGGTSAAEVSPEYCDPDAEMVLTNSSSFDYDGYLSPITFFNVENGRMHFRTDMGYGTSTANSSYIRSELRELFNAENLGTCSTKNTDQMTSWFIDDTATGTNVHKLTSSLRIDEYPVISGQDPKVVVGQVHGWEISQALVKVLWEGENKPVRVSMNQDFFHDNQKCDSSSPTNNCDTWPFSIELGEYAANVEWQYVIQVDEHGIYLATWDAASGESSKVEKQLLWGVPFDDRNGDSVTLSTKWIDEAYYFKAGIYPQFKPDDNYQGERFDVSFSQVLLEHR